MNQKGFTNIVLAVFAAVLVGGAGYFVFTQKSIAPAPVPSPTPSSTSNSTSSVPNPGTSTVSVALGEKFTLREGESVRVGNTSLEVGITAFYNSPCPAGVQCIWSGVGTGFEYRFKGEVRSGIDLVQAFGYETTILKTDHETYADLIVQEAAD